MPKVCVTLREAQQADREILAEIDRVCRQHDIPYFIDAGTLLGAVRHQGFIPWDDDIDLLMTREAFGRFADACKTDLNAPFELVMPNEYGGHFFDFIPRVIRNDMYTHTPNAVDKKYNNRNNLIAVDLFFMDNAPDSKLGFSLHCMRLKMIYGLAMGHRLGVFTEKRTVLETLQVAVLSTLGKLIPFKALLRHYMAVSQKYNKKQTQTMLRSNTPLWELCMAFQWAWYAKTIELPFDGAQRLAPVGYDPALRVMYGDYMKLPPEDQRFSKHYRNDDDPADQSA